MRPSLFRSGLAPRLAAAVLYGLLAFGAVALLAPAGTPGEARPRVAFTAPTEAAPQPATLCVESLHAVATWDVRIDGAPVGARHSDTTTWIADAVLAPDAALVIDAIPAGNGPAARNALRIRVAGTPVSRDQTHWCERAWSVTTRVDRIARAAAPIDPAALP